MPRDRSRKSATTAPAKYATRQLCRNLPRPIPELPPEVMANPRRARAIIAAQSKWVNGTVLHYCFFKSGHFSVPKTQADAVRGAFAKWKAIGIGRDFQEVSQL